MRTSWTGIGLTGLLLVLLILGATSWSEITRDRTSDFFHGLLATVDKLYIDGEKLRPDEMMRGAMTALESADPGIFVDGKGLPAEPLKVQLADAERGFVLPQPLTLRGLASSLAAIFEFLGDSYRGENTLEDLSYAAANGLLRTLDPHTLVFSPKQYKEFFTHVEGEIFGVGMYIGIREGVLTVISPLRDTPAFRAGIQAGDVITKIDEESTVSMSSSEAVSRIRGPRGTPVSLTIERKGVDAPFTTEIVRDKIEIKSVESAIIRPGIGFLKMIAFSQTTMPSVRKHLARLVEENKGELDGLILDLRDDPGGLMEQAVELADTFLKKGDIVITHRRGEFLPTEAKDDENEPAYPIVVMVSEGTASGSEIVAGALQKNDRAIIMGRNTFGKGSVQRLFPLGLGAHLKITFSEYLLAGRVSIQASGVTPDIYIHTTPLRKGQFDLFPDERRFQEKDYRGHFESEFVTRETPAETISLWHKPPEADPKSDPRIDPFITGAFDFKNDPSAQLALEIIELGRGLGTPFSRKAFLRQRAEGIRKINEREFAKIVEKLKEVGIDWSAGETPPDAKVSLRMEYEVREPSPEEGLDDGVRREVPLEDEEEGMEGEPDRVPRRTLTARATLRNEGDRPVYRLKGISRSDYFLYDEREFLFGKVNPGEEVARACEIRVPYFTRARQDTFRVEASGESGRALTTGSVEVTLPEIPRASFAFATELLDTAGKERKESVSSGDDVILRVRVENTGAGKLIEGIGILRNEDRKDIFLKTGRQVLKDLDPGKSVDLDFQFRVQPDSELETHKFHLLLADSYSTETLEFDLEVPAATTKKTYPNGKRYVPPRIVASIRAAEQDPSILVTKADRVPVSARIEDDGPIAQAMIFTSSIQEIDKIYFQRGGTRRNVMMSAPVQIRPGTNVITVVATDGDNLRSEERFYVRRDEEPIP